MQRHFRRFPSDTQIAAYKTCSYLVASPRFDARREQFERWCKVQATPLVIIWPFANRRRSVTMQLFNCTNSILDKEFKEAVRKLAEIWGASTHQANRLPVSIADVTPRHARVLAGYLTSLAAEAYKRRATRVTYTVVTDGPASDGQPVGAYGLFSGSYVFPVKGQRNFTCILHLENGEQYQGGLIGTREPESVLLQREFGNNPSAFQLLHAPETSP